MTTTQTQTPFCGAGRMVAMVMQTGPMGKPPGEWVLTADEAAVEIGQPIVLDHFAQLLDIGVTLL